MEHRERQPLPSSMASSSSSLAVNRTAIVGETGAAHRSRTAASLATESALRGTFDAAETRICDAGELNEVLACAPDAVLCARSALGRPDRSDGAPSLAEYAGAALTWLDKAMDPPANLQMNDQLRSRSSEILHALLNAMESHDAAAPAGLARSHALERVRSALSRAVQTYAGLHLNETRLLAHALGAGDTGGSRVGARLRLMSDYLRHPYASREARETVLLHFGRSVPKWQVSDAPIVSNLLDNIQNVVRTQGIGDAALLRLQSALEGAVQPARGLTLDPEIHEKLRGVIAMLQRGATTETAGRSTV